MVLKKTAKKTAKLGGSYPKLTKTEQEVLFYLTKEFLTPKQISTRRGTKLRATYYTIEKLKEKGIINNHFAVVQKKGMWYQDSAVYSSNKIRFHALEFNIKILFKDYRYKKTFTKSNMLDIDGNTIRLYRDALEVYINTSFYGDSVEEARKNGFIYCEHLFKKIESRLNIIIKKPDHANIKLVKQHFAEVNNEFAKDLNSKKEKLQIRGDDNKVYALVDNSHNLNEFECVHPEFAEDDMKIIKPFFDELRKNPTTTTELMNFIVILLKNQNNMANNIKEMALSVNVLSKMFYPEGLKDKSKSDDDGSVSKEKPDYFG